MRLINACSSSPCGSELNVSITPICANRLAFRSHHMKSLCTCCEHCLVGTTILIFHYLFKMSRVLMIFPPIEHFIAEDGLDKYLSFSNVMTLSVMPLKIISLKRIVLFYSEPRKSSCKSGVVDKKIAKCFYLTL